MNRPLALVSLIVSIFGLPAAGLAGGGGPAVIGTLAQAPPGTPGVMIAFDYLGTGSTVTSGRFEIALVDVVGASAAALTVTGLSCAAPFTCPASLADPFVFADPLGAEVASLDEAVMITIDAGGAAVPGDFIGLAVRNEAYQDAASNPIPPSGSVDGVFRVAFGPQVAVPNVQPPELMQSSAVNQPGATAPLTISGVGAAGAASFTIDCTLEGLAADPGVDLRVADFSGTLGPGESATVQSNCAGSAPGAATATYVCASSSPGKINDRSVITCGVVAPEIVPALTRSGSIVIALGLLALAAWTLRRRTA